MLRKEEIDSFLTGTLWLDCPELELRPADRESQPYTGAGYIRQDETGRLTFTLYAVERIGGIADIAAFGMKPGTFTSELPAYELVARDSNNRRWTTEVRLFETHSVFDVPGVMCRGDLHSLRNVTQRGAHDVDSMWMHIPQDLRLPTNVTSWTEIRRVNEVVERSGTTDTWQFAREDREFTFRKTGNSTTLHLVAPPGHLPSGFDSRVEEALRFTFAEYVWWSILVENRGTESISTLRPSGGSKPVRAIRRSLTEQ